MYWFLYKKMTLDLREVFKNEHEKLCDVSYAK